MSSISTILKFPHSAMRNVGNRALFSTAGLALVTSMGVSTLSLPVMAAPQEACIKTSNGDVMCGTPVAKPPKSNQTAVETTIDSQTEYGVTFELKSCIRGSKNLVSCTLVLSSDTDRNIGLHAAQWTKIVDSSGNEYIANKVQIGKKADRNTVPVSMAKGASYRAIFNFPDVPTSVSKVVLFQISAVGGYYINFRNFPIN
jgi:hypothetical protein